MSQPLSPEVKQLLQDLQPERPYAGKIEAARKLGELSESDLEIVHALVSALESDPGYQVRKMAAQSLQASVHQEILQQHLDLMASVQQILRQRPDLLKPQAPLGKGPSAVELAQEKRGTTQEAGLHSDRMERSIPMAYEYKMIQVPPNIVLKAKEVRGNEAAHYLQSIANEQAAAGWEFYRVDTVGVVTQPGCLPSLFGAKQTLIEYYVVTFRKAK